MASKGRKAAAAPAPLLSSDDGQESLLTQRALNASLSAPRAPPHGTAHRALLLGKAPDSHPWSVLHHHHLYHRHHHHHHRRDHDHDDHDNDQQQRTHEAHSQNSHGTLRQRLRERLRRSHWDCPAPRLPHPHLAAGPELSDHLTRFLGVALPLSWQNACRDSGTARSLFDCVVPATAPLLALANPSAVPAFLRLSAARRLKRIRYGPHDRQAIDLFLPDEKNGKPTTVDGDDDGRLIVFVHGGAWGSGHPWMYRLVAQPFLERGWTVAILGYRTYPDGCAAEQVADCELATRTLEKEYPDLFEGGRVTLMGHSSGSHIALMMLVERIERAMAMTKTVTVQDSTKNKGTENKSLFGFDSFVGLSGPYDISHHFDYEAARGVEEFSPMKPVCGYTREGFRRNSPALRLQATLAEERSLLPLCPKLCFLHGIEDATVPFTATAEAARIVRSCGLTECDEIYVADTGHQDTVMQLMLGGRTRTAVIEWLVGLDSAEPVLSSTSKSNKQSLVAIRSRM